MLRRCLWGDLYCSAQTRISGRLCAAADRPRRRHCL